MNINSRLFKAGNYMIFANGMLFNIYHVTGNQAEYMMGGFYSLGEAIDYLLHP